MDRNRFPLLDSHLLAPLSPLRKIAQLGAQKGCDCSIGTVADTNSGFGV